MKGALAFAVMLMSIMCVFAFSSSAASEDGKWITAWGTAPTEIGIEGYDNISAYIGNVTARTVITPTADGTELRIRLSNVYGTSPLKIRRVTVAKSAGGSKIVKSSLKSVLFNDGQPTVSIPAGKEYLSDPVKFDVKAGEPIAISIFIEDFTEIKTMGLSGGETYLSLPLGDKKDFTEEETMDLGTVLEGQEITEYLTKIVGGDLDLKLQYSFIKVVPCLASVEVRSDENAYSVVVIGDSTVANEFPQYLGEAISDKGYKNVGIVGKGIMGNRLLGDGLGYGGLIYGDSLIDRFKRDVLTQSGVKYAVIKIGANDIIHPVCTDIKEQYPDIKQPTSDELIAGYKKIFDMCHKAGIKVIVMSITPWKGATRDYFGTGDKYVRTTAEFEKDWKIATTVNSWLSKTNLHDGYVNVNKYSVSEKDTSAFLPEYTIDGIHPSDSMQKVWATKFPVSLVGVGKTVGGLSLDKTSATLYKGDKLTLKPTIYPSGATNKNVKWYSSNSKVLKVSSSGVVECVGRGTATITCKTEDGGYKATCKITVRDRVSGVTLSKSKVTVYTTKTYQLKATVAPSTAYNKKVTWSSSNTKVAKVDKNGLVTAVGTGKAVITVKTDDGGKKASCSVTVKKKIQVTDLSLNRTSRSLYKGSTYQLKATVYPEKATFPEVKWTTSNKRVATVSSAGKVTAKGKGTAVITCTNIDNPRIKATFKVTVKIKVSDVELNHSKGSLYEGYTGRLRATVSPSDASNKDVKWSSSNTKVLKVDKNGKLTAVKPGKAVITVTTENGGYKDTCTVTVKKVTPVKAVKLNKTSVKLADGKTYQLKATISPEKASIKDLKWSSSDSKVVKVSSSGKLTAVNPGSAVITVKSKQGGKTAKCTVKVTTVKAKSIELNKTSVKLGKGSSYQLKATVLPSNATSKSVKWSSSNPEAVSVSSKGLIKALKSNSSAVITCKTADGKITATCKVKVSRVKVTGVKLNKTSASLAVGKTVQLFAAVSPSTASVKTVTWSSSNKSVATVDSNGLVKAKSGGKATIYCKTKDGEYVAACKITVSGAKVFGVKISQSKVNATKGQSFTLKAEIVPSNAANQRVTWSSNKPNVAKVDSNGKVTCVGKGECQIRVTTVEGSFDDVCVVIVN